MKQKIVPHTYYDCWRKKYFFDSMKVKYKFDENILYGELFLLSSFIGQSQKINLSIMGDVSKEFFTKKHVVKTLL